MRVIRKINNNVAICTDRDKKELIAFGKGIGFPKMPYELNDLGKIDRTYYGVNKSILAIINEIPEEIIDIAAKIVDYATSRIDNEISNNIVFTLADHIHFALQRYENKMTVQMPFEHDIQFHYEVEMDIGEKALTYINKVKKIHLPKEEIVGIALHFINSENVEIKESDTNQKIIQDVTEIIENRYDFKIEKIGFNYSRFVSHMQYLLKRQKDNLLIVSDNGTMFESIKREYRSTYECALEIDQYISQNYHWSLSEEEMLYLMLHVNRLCSRVDKSD